jgi:inositol transport system permease protein
MEKVQGFKLSRITAFLGRYSIFVILISVFIISALLNRNFLSVNNLSNILKQNSVVTILAFGETMLIIAGLIDLASGAVLAIAGVFAVTVVKITGNIWLGFAVGIATGIFFNFISGLLVSVYKTPPFIATLAVTTIARGMALLFTA